jgi:dTDP-4-amino-4,6-dideoxygalactose transaminase
MGAVVPFVDLERQHAPLRAELTEAFERVVGSSGFILGAEVDAFEREFAEFCGVEHCVGVASGTAAIALTLTAAGIGPGDEVIVPGHTFIASALGVLHAGATPVLCDVNEGDGLIDAAAAESVCGERTAAILAVHLYGQVCAMEPLRDVTARRGLRLFEDAAQAHGAGWRDERAGALGDGAAFSFYPSKNLGALGDGGAVCTDDAEIAGRVRALRHLGQHTKGEHRLLGYNERLDGLQAALLRVKLPHLESWNAGRRRAAARYRELLEGRVRIVEESPETPSIHHLFPIRVPDRDRFAGHLGELGVQTGVHYTPAVRDHPALEGRLRTPADLSESAAWAAEELSLPMFAELRDDELERAAAACLSALGVSA